jgi:acyl-CoA dehydrogenase
MMALGARSRAALDEVLPVVAENAASTDRDAAFPVDALTALRRTGLLGLMVPIEHDGFGGDLADLAAVTLELGRVDMSMAMIFAMHCQQVLVIDRFGDDDLRKEVLTAVAHGDIYLGSVTTDRHKGATLTEAASTTTLADDLLHIDRDAPIVTGGAFADAFLITALAPDATAPSQVSLVYATRDQMQVETTGSWQPLGMRATHSVAMRLVGAVPRRQTVGVSGGFREMVISVFGPVAHIGWAAAWLGAATGAYSRVVSYIRTPAGRRQLDTSSDLLLTRLAGARVRLECVYGLLTRAVDVMGSGRDSSLPSIQLLLNSLKVRAADECFAVVDELIELVGLRQGYFPDDQLWLERVFRDLRSGSLNFSNTRLNLSSGSLVLLDPAVRFA